MNRRGRVTIMDVAKEAGVSKQTVSRVLNDRPDVAPDTRKQIKDIIESLGYRPSAVARSLIQQRSFTLGVVTAGLQYLGPSQTLNGIADKAKELGYALLLIVLPSFDSKDTRPIVDSLIARQVDGIIWAVQEVGENRVWLQDQLSTLPVPIIFLTMAKRENFSIVSVDNFTGGKMATQHLVEQGCQKIGHVSGPLDWWEARQRIAGWESALTEAGIEADSVPRTEGNWSSRSGAAAFKSLLDKYPQMDGVFVGNDQMALSVMQIAHDRGIRIPNDLAVVGFDGLAESAYFWPALTTINQNQHELGCIAVQEIVAMID
ncbi:MAG: substrate-binding domain-containing protein, partial [Gammaproteobacteria bacterium]|nr:substrate-binding domain-containing protein [Gammaproteobacteria bacterium]